MITTNDSAMAELAWSLRNHGANLNGSDYLRVSANFRMPEPSAAIGLVQLKRLKCFVERRNEIAAYYNLELKSMAGIRPLPVHSLSRHAYWNYIAVLDDRIERAGLAAVLLREFGVEVAWPYDPPCHLQPVFGQVLGTKAGDLPQSERILAHHLALPMHPALSNEDAAYVIDSLRRTLARSAQP